MMIANRGTILAAALMTSLAPAYAKGGQCSNVGSPFRIAPPNVITPDRPDPVNFYYTDVWIPVIADRNDLGVVRASVQIFDRKGKLRSENGQVAPLAFFEVRSNTTPVSTIFAAYTDVVPNNGGMRPRDFGRSLRVILSWTPEGGTTRFSCHDSAFTMEIRKVPAR